MNSQNMKINGIPVNELPGLMTYQDLAKFLKRSPNTLRQDCSKGKIPYRKVGGSVRFMMSDILTWLESKAVKARR